jgi:hypothetical protein
MNPADHPISQRNRALVEVPTGARRVPGESGGVGQQRREPMHPPVRWWSLRAAIGTSGRLHRP